MIREADEPAFFKENVARQEQSGVFNENEKAPLKGLSALQAALKRNQRGVFNVDHEYDLRFTRSEMFETLS